LAEALKKSGLVSSEKCDMEIDKKRKAELSREQRLVDRAKEKDREKVEDEGDAA